MDLENGGIPKVKTNTLLLGDAYKYIKIIDDNSVDLIIIDPPYEISKGGKGNGYMSQHFRSLTDELVNANVTEGIDLAILDEFLRVMKKPNIYIWCNKKQILDYLNFFVGIHKCAFEILTWIKSNPIPAYGRNYLNDKEYCLYFRKGIQLTTTYQSGKTYWITPANVKDKKVYNHPTIKPLWITKTLIENASKSGDVVLDCFFGSGTTAVAAIETNRQYIGIEQNTKYFETSVRRIHEAEARNPVTSD